MCQQGKALDPALAVPVDNAQLQKNLREQAKRHAMNDLAAGRKEYLFAPPGFIDRPLKKLLNDERDAPIAYVFFNIVVTVVPGAVALYLLPASHFLGVVYLALTQALFLPRFALALHYSVHRTLFVDKKGAGLLNRLPNHFLSVFFGIPSGMYKLHHLVMHHVANNEWGSDISSTEPYQRDNFFHLLLYVTRYAVGAWVELPYYAFKKQRYGLSIQCVLSAMAYFAMVHMLYSVKPIQTLWAFVIPFCITSFALMFGNWSQHALIEPSNPESNYLLTYNCVDVGDNQMSFNDGYHVLHHLNSKIHWSELPKRFIETMDKHAEEDAVVFQGIAPFEVGVRLMFKNYEYLADKWLDLSSPKRTREEKAAIIKRRVQPVQRTKRH